MQNWTFYFNRIRRQIVKLLVVTLCSNLVLEHAWLAAQAEPVVTAPVVTASSARMSVLQALNGVTNPISHLNGGLVNNLVTYAKGNTVLVNYANDVANITAALASATVAAAPNPDLLTPALINLPEVQNSYTPLAATIFFSNQPNNSFNLVSYNLLAAELLYVGANANLVNNINSQQAGFNPPATSPLINFFQPNKATYSGLSLDADSGILNKTASFCNYMLNNTPFNYLTTGATAQLNTVWLGAICTSNSHCCGNNICLVPNGATLGKTAGNVPYGYCSLPPNCSVTCSIDTDCCNVGGPQHCLNQQCVKCFASGTGPCAQDSDCCGANSSCSSRGQCLIKSGAACNLSTVCGNGYICDSKKFLCLPTAGTQCCPSTSTGCTINVPCANQLICSTNYANQSHCCATLHSACSKASDCCPNLGCDIPQGATTGTCKGGPGTLCADAATDCLPVLGLTCGINSSGISGVCTYPACASSDTNCPTCLSDEECVLGAICDTTPDVEAHCLAYIPANHSCLGRDPSNNYNCGPDLICDVGGSDLCVNPAGRCAALGGHCDSYTDCCHPGGASAKPVTCDLSVYNGTENECVLLGGPGSTCASANECSAPGLPDLTCSEAKLCCVNAGKTCIADGDCCIDDPKGPMDCQNKLCTYTCIEANYSCDDTIACCPSNMDPDVSDRAQTCGYPGNENDPASPIQNDDITVCYTVLNPPGAACLNNTDCQYWDTNSMDACIVNPDSATLAEMPKVCCAGPGNPCSSPKDCCADDMYCTSGICNANASETHVVAYALTGVGAVALCIMSFVALARWVKKAPINHYIETIGQMLGLADIDIAVLKKNCANGIFDNIYDTNETAIQANLQSSRDLFLRSVATALYNKLNKGQTAADKLVLMKTKNALGITSQGVAAQADFVDLISRTMSTVISVRNGEQFTRVAKAQLDTAIQPISDAKLSIKAKISKYLTCNGGMHEATLAELSAVVGKGPVEAAHAIVHTAAVHTSAAARAIWSGVVDPDAIHEAEALDHLAALFDIISQVAIDPGLKASTTAASLAARSSLTALDPSYISNIKPITNVTIANLEVVTARKAALINQFIAEQAGKDITDISKVASPVLAELIMTDAALRGAADELGGKYDVANLTQLVREIVSKGPAIFADVATIITNTQKLANGARATILANGQVAPDIAQFSEAEMATLSSTSLTLIDTIIAQSKILTEADRPTIAARLRAAFAADIPVGNKPDGTPGDPYFIPAGTADPASFHASDLPFRVAAPE